MVEKNKIAISLLIALIVIIAIKFILPAHKSNIEITEEFWFEKTHNKSKKNIVVGGNSRIYRGVSITKMLGAVDKDLSGINLGYSSLGLSSEYLEFLKSKVDLNSDYKFIILGITPGSLTEKAAQNEHLHQYLDMGQSELIKTSFLKNYSNFSPYKPQELVNVFKKRNGYIEEEKDYFSKYNPDGWVASYKFPFDSTEALSKYEIYYSPEDVVVSKIMVDSLISKIEEFVISEITVIAFRPPTTIQMEALENRLLKFDEALFKSKLIEAGGIWLDINSADFKSYDGSHLHYLSAEKLSVILGEKINQICISKGKE